MIGGAGNVRVLAPEHSEGELDALAKSAQALRMAAATLAGVALPVGSKPPRVATGSPPTAAWPPAFLTASASV